jgi:hypothetical protein
MSQSQRRLHPVPAAPRQWPVLARGLALLALAGLGLATLVGSGGGLPPCTAPFCDRDPLPPPAMAKVVPSHATLQVGQSTQFTVQPTNLTAPYTYEWYRSSDGGTTFTQVAGATGASVVVGPVNLADDGAIYSGRVLGSNGLSASARGRVTVSAQPGLVFSDGEFAPASWQLWPVVGPNPLAPAHTETQQASGGNPGAWRRMVFTLPAGTGSGYVAYLSTTAVYDPALQGALKVIDYAEDCLGVSDANTAFAESQLLLVQASRSYVAPDSDKSCLASQWHTAVSRASLRAVDFRLFDGPACPSGGSCPDFSATAPPLRLGYLRLVYGSPGMVVTHGIDNWRVTLWRP